MNTTQLNPAVEFASKHFPSFEDFREVMQRMLTAPISIPLSWADRMPGDPYDPIVRWNQVITGSLESVELPYRRGPRYTVPFDRLDPAAPGSPMQLAARQFLGRNDTTQLRTEMLDAIRSSFPTPVSMEELRINNYGEGNLSLQLIRPIEDIEAVFTVPTLTRPVEDAAPQTVPRCIASEGAISQLLRQHEPHMVIASLNSSERSRVHDPHSVRESIYRKDYAYAVAVALNGGQADRPPEAEVTKDNVSKRAGAGIAEFYKSPGTPEEVPCTPLQGFCSITVGSQQHYLVGPSTERLRRGQYVSITGGGDLPPGVRLAGLPFRCHYIIQDMIEVPASTYRSHVCRDEEDQVTLDAERDGVPILIIRAQIGNIRNQIHNSGRQETPQPLSLERAIEDTIDNRILVEAMAGEARRHRAEQLSNDLVNRQLSSMNGARTEQDS